jgi:integrase
MAGLRQRGNQWEAKVRIPKALRAEHGERDYLYRTLTGTRKAAKVEADAWEAGLRIDWAERSGDIVSGAELRALYQQTRADAAAGRYLVCVGHEDPVEEGIEYEIDKIADTVGPEADPSPVQQTRLDALNDAKIERRGLPVPLRPQMELTLSELAEAFMRWWKAQRGLKASNTEQQKRATFSLFAGYWGDRPMRAVTRPEATAFMDGLRHMDPLWARSPDARNMTWAELQLRFGNRPQGLSDATLNRHAATMRALWNWGADRGHCGGRNPFTGHHARLKQGVNVDGYVAWENPELTHLLTPPPRRRDLLEIIHVGLFSGMRLNEIAALRWGDVKKEDGVWFFDIADAKTLAGKRQVPVHPALGWLLERHEGASQTARIWNTFNPEGPGKKPGADAGREFSRFKASRGFADRRKAFHSFRKNVTRQIERAGIPQSEWAQVFGHERGFTYGVYNPDGIAIGRKAEIIALIGYDVPALKDPPT